MELIDRKAITEHIRNKIDMQDLYLPIHIIQLIDELPTIEAEPVIHAKWIFSPAHSEGACTNCNYKIYGRPYQNTYLIVPYNYCPNCGAKMDGGR